MMHRARVDGRHRADGVDGAQQPPGAGVDDQYLGTTSATEVHLGVPDHSGTHVPAGAASLERSLSGEFVDDGTGVPLIDIAFGQRQFGCRT